MTENDIKLGRKKLSYKEKKHQIQVMVSGELMIKLFGDNTSDKLKKAKMKRKIENDYIRTL